MYKLPFLPRCAVLARYILCPLSVCLSVYLTQSKSEFCQNGYSRKERRTVTHALWFSEAEDRDEVPMESLSTATNTCELRKIVTFDK